MSAIKFTTVHRNGTPVITLIHTTFGIDGYMTKAKLEYSTSKALDLFDQLKTQLKKQGYKL